MPKARRRHGYRVADPPSKQSRGILVYHIGCREGGGATVPWGGSRFHTRGGATAAARWCRRTAGAHGPPHPLALQAHHRVCALYVQLRRTRACKCHPVRSPPCCHFLSSFLPDLPGRPHRSSALPSRTIRNIFVYLSPLPGPACSGADYPLMRGALGAWQPLRQSLQPALRLPQRHLRPLSRLPARQRIPQALASMQPAVS